MIQTYFLAALENDLCPGYNSNVSLDDTALRSLVALLDDEDPRSLELVRRHLLDVGVTAIPFLEEARSASAPGLAARFDEMAAELRFQDLQREFETMSRQRVPDLETGSLLLARFVRPGADAPVYVRWLDRVAAAVADELPEDATTDEATRHISAHLFQAMGFAGNESNYYDPDNSCLTRVIDTRRGIPVTLSILYLLIAKRLRVAVFGVGTPGHFLIGYRHNGDTRFLDAFRSGQPLETAEVRRMLVRNGYEYRPDYLKPCGPREILLRMMRNLLSIYQKTGDGDHAERLSVLVEIVLTGGASSQAE